MYGEVADVALLSSHLSRLTQHPVQRIRQHDPTSPSGPLVLTRHQHDRKLYWDLSAICNRPQFSFKLVDGYREAK